MVISNRASFHTCGSKRIKFHKCGRRISREGKVLTKKKMFIFILLRVGFTSKRSQSWKWSSHCTVFILFVQHIIQLQNHYAWGDVSVKFNMENNTKTQLGWNPLSKCLIFGLLFCWITSKSTVRLIMRKRAAYVYVYMKSKMILLIHVF